MKVRAEASEETGQRILEVAQKLFGELLYDQVSLQEVANQAEVSVQTVFRRFESKEQLFAATMEFTSKQIREKRDQAPVGDVIGAVSNLIETYERWGDHTLNRLAQEQRAPLLQNMIDAGRRHHCAWVERVFAPHLVSDPPQERKQRLAQLVAVTDLYVWKVLRHDVSLSQEETEMAMRDLVNRIICTR